MYKNLYYYIVLKKFDSKILRKKMGFGNQTEAKDFLKAKDIDPVIDFDYLAKLNERLAEITIKLNSIVDQKIKYEDMTLFNKENIFDFFTTMQQHLPKLNNQGRRRERVYFDWMRGYVVAKFFEPAYRIIFDNENIVAIGDDNPDSVKTFNRTAKSDYETTLNDKKIRIEVQSGFSGINDIKKHKITEAKNNSDQYSTYLIHFDIYNVKAVILRIDDIEEDHQHWEQRQQMEGQFVFSIKDEYFKWSLADCPIKIEI